MIKLIWISNSFTHYCCSGIPFSHYALLHGTESILHAKTEVSRHLVCYGTCWPCW